MADDEPGLSFSDEIILREIRAGRRDPEIAVKLGVTTGNVRARIERLLRVSSLDSRAALGLWDPELAPPTLEPLPVAEPEPRPTHSRVPWVSAGIGLATVVLAAVALGFFVTRPTNEAVPAAPTAPPTSQPLATTSRLPVKQLRFVAASPFPADLLLYIVRGCEGCAAPIALDRVYRDQFGTVRTDVLFRPDTSEGRHLMAVWAQRDGSDLVVSVCDRGSCGVRGPITSDAATRFYRSRDGGATWADAGSVDGAGETVSGSGGDLILVRVERGDTVEYAVLGGDGTADPASLLPQGAPPEFTLLAQLDAETIQGLSRISTSANGAFAYTWYPYSPSPDEDGVATRLGIADRWGNTALLLEYVGAPLALGAWLDLNTVTATVALPNGAVTSGDVASARRLHLPVLIDTVRGTVAALPEPFTNARYSAAINHVAAALRGQFVRTGAHDAGCVPLFVAPRYDAREAGCLAEGALVTFVETRMVVSEEWQAVRPASGRPGWVRPADLDAFK